MFLLLPRPWECQPRPLESVRHVFLPSSYPVLCMSHAPHKLSDAHCAPPAVPPLCRSAPPVFLAVLAVISRYPGRVYVSVPGPPLCSWLGLSAGAPSIHAGRGAAPTDASTARNPTAMASDSDTEEFFDAPEDVTLTCSPGV